MNIKRYILISLLVFLGFGCDDDDFPVPQTTSVAVKFSFSTDNDGFAPAKVTFTNESVVREGVSEVVYTWNFGDGTSSSEINPVHEYTEPGSYDVSLVAVVAGDDIDYEKQLVTIKDPKALEAQVFFIDAGESRIYDLDGNSFAVDGFGTGIAYDAVNDKLYFTDADNKTLVRANLDGSEKEIISNELSDPRDLALDMANNKAYVADRGTNSIYQVDLSSKSTSVLYDNVGELPVGIDFYDGFIYVTCVEIDAESVWKGNVDGSGISKIIDYTAGGYGYGVAIDPVNEKIYFDNVEGGETGQIWKANLDGTGIAPFIDTSNRVYGISVDNLNGKVYWTERNSGSVFMANLDGTGKVILSSDFNDPRGVFHIE